MKNILSSQEIVVLPDEDGKAKTTEQASTPESTNNLMTKKDWIFISIIITVVVICFVNCLPNGFVLDDHDLILQRRMVRHIEDIPKLFSYSHNPLRNLSYAIDYSIWGENPLGFHLSNILIHAGNCVLLYFLVRCLIGKSLPSLLAALIFAVHPIQSEAVAYISDRMDVLFTFFYLASFMSYLAYKRHIYRKKLYLTLFVTFWILSLMSKEMAASLLIVIFVWNLCDKWKGTTGPYVLRLFAAIRESLKADKWLYAFLFVAVSLFALYTIFIKHATVRMSAGGVDYWGGSFYTNVLTVSRVHTWYLKQLVYPTPIAQYYGAFAISKSIFEYKVIISLLILIGIFGAGLSLLTKRPLVTFALLSYFAMLAPVSHLIPHHELLADHYLYLPILSFSLLIGLAYDEIASLGSKYAVTALCIIVSFVAAFGLLTIRRNKDWKDDFTVWKVNYEAVPNSPCAAYNLAGQYLGRNPRKAQDLYLRSLQLDNTYAPSYTNLARLYLSQGQIKEAEYLIDGGLSLNDSDINTFATRSPGQFKSELMTVKAVVTQMRGDESKAVQLLLEAISLDGGNEEPYAMLASLYDKKKEIDAEIDILKTAVSWNPQSIDMLKQLSFILVDLKRYEEARIYLEKLIRIEPDDFFPNYELGQIYRTWGDCLGGKRHLSKSMQSAKTDEEKKIVREAIMALEQQCGK